MHCTWRLIYLPGWVPTKRAWKDTWMQGKFVSVQLVFNHLKMICLSYLLSKIFLQKTSFLLMKVEMEWPEVDESGMTYTSWYWRYRPWRMQLRTSGITYSSSTGNKLWVDARNQVLLDLFKYRTRIKFSPFMIRIRSRLNSQCRHVRSLCRAFRNYTLLETSPCIGAHFHPNIGCLICPLLDRNSEPCASETHREFWFCEFAGRWLRPTYFLISFSMRKSSASTT